MKIWPLPSLVPRPMAALRNPLKEANFPLEVLRPQPERGAKAAAVCGAGWLPPPRRVLATQRLERRRCSSRLINSKEFFRRGC